MQQPNILWICTDQQRWNTLGCYGNQHVHTPHLDKLAASGTLFERAYSQSTVCTPSRASFLTGRYPRTTRCRQNGQNIPDDETLVTKVLSDNGYTCGLAGKLHISACAPAVCPGVERRIDDGYSEFNWSHSVGAHMTESNAYRQWLESQGKQYQTENHPGCKHVKFGMPEELHQTTWCADRAIDFMERHNEQPWLFSINMFDPHKAFDPPRKHFERYLNDLDSIPLPHYMEGELDNKSPYQRVDHIRSHGGESALGYSLLAEQEHKVIRAAYWAMCDQIDTQIGRLLDYLEQSDQLDNTIIIFHADHGEMLGDHGIYLKGPYFYEEAVHIPLIMSCPNHIKQQRSSALVELVDIAQTILDAAGIDHHPGMQGNSLWPLLTGAQDANQHRETAYSEFHNATGSHKDPSAFLSMLRDERYKIVIDHTHNDGELYDLDKDPHEYNNLWGNSDYQTEQARLSVALCNRLAFTVDPLPPRIAGF